MHKGELENKHNGILNFSQAAHVTSLPLSLPPFILFLTFYKDNNF